MTRDLRRVLIVDDEDPIRRMLAVAMQQRSLVVDEARDGREAIALLSQNSYAVVVLDLLMPVADGFSVLESIDADGIDSPIVLVVSGADRHVLDRLDGRRMHGVIRKPFDPLEVAGVVAACVDIRSRSAFETMALATVISGGALLSLLTGQA